MIELTNLQVSFTLPLTLQLMRSVVDHAGVMDVYSEVNTLAEGAFSYLESSYFLVSNRGCSSSNIIWLWILAVVIWIWNAPNTTPSNFPV